MLLLNKFSADVATYNIESEFSTEKLLFFFLIILKGPPPLCLKKGLEGEGKETIVSLKPLT